MGKCRRDFDKYLALKSSGFQGDCFSLWVLTGAAPSAVDDAFARMLLAAEDPARPCICDIGASPSEFARNPRVGVTHLSSF